MAADANRTIKMIADFILSHSQPNENKRNKIAEKLKKLHSLTQTSAGAMKIPRIDSKYTFVEHPQQENNNRTESEKQILWNERGTTQKQR